MTETITDKREIEKIIAEKINGKKLVFTKYYDMSIAQKGLTLIKSARARSVALQKSFGF